MNTLVAPSPEYVPMQLESASIEPVSNEFNTATPNSNLRSIGGNALQGFGVSWESTGDEALDQNTFSSNWLNEPKDTSDHNDSDGERLLFLMQESDSLRKGIFNLNEKDVNYGENAKKLILESLKRQTDRDKVEFPESEYIDANGKLHPKEGQLKYIPDNYIDMTLSPTDDGGDPEAVAIEKEMIISKFLPELTTFLKEYGGLPRSVFEQAAVGQVQKMVLRKLPYDYSKNNIREKGAKAVDLASKQKGLVYLDQLDSGVCRHQALTFQVISQFLGLDSEVLYNQVYSENTKTGEKSNPGFHVANVVKVLNKDGSRSGQIADTTHVVNSEQESGAFVPFIFDLKNAKQEVGGVEALYLPNNRIKRYRRITDRSRHAVAKTRR